jgi:uncharacterized membrane protein YiaA
MMKIDFVKSNKKEKQLSSPWGCLLLLSHTSSQPNLIMTPAAVTTARPSAAFIYTSWFALLAGVGAFLVGLVNAAMALNEKGYYFTILMFGLFAVVSLQKTVRDKLEKIPVTGLYYGLAWFATLVPIMLLFVGLWNATLLLSEKGFYAMAFLLALFGAIAVQKNTRDMRLLPSSPAAPVDTE